MSDRYKGAILSPTAPTVTPQSAGGVYTLSQQTQYQGQGVWPTAVNYPINNSLRFRSSASANLTRTPASASNRRTWTWSGWVKRGALGSFRGLFTANYSSVPWFFLGFGSGNTLDVAATAGSSASWQTTAVFRDPSAWCHVVLAVDTTSATSTMNGSSTDRFRLYVNGVQYVISGGTVPTQNSDLQVNNTVSHTVGGYSGEFFDGYLGEVNFIDGTALTPSSFGTTDAYGIWQPIPYTGTYGTNGFYLKFTDNSALTTSSNVGLGKDFSGNGNYWVTNNISITAGSTYDSMTDVPTNTNSNTANYCVLNPINLGDNNTLSNANLSATIATTSGRPVYGSIAVTSGKWYWETLYVSSTADNLAVGVNGAGLGQNINAFSTSPNIIYYSSFVSRNNTEIASGLAVSTTNDIIGVGLNLDASTISFYKNNTLLTTQNLPTGDGSGWRPVWINATSAGNQSFAANFGQRPFSYTPPTGFNRLNTYNLPTPTILAGNQYMDAITRNGFGTSGGSVATNFQADLIWEKPRNITQSHYIVDSVRGITSGTAPFLSSNSTSQEQNANWYNAPTPTSISFNSNDWGTSTTLVDWIWRANAGTNVSNTQGTITSTVSANTTAGFSIVTFTGNGTSSQTVGHGLGVAPAMIIEKRRNAGQNWYVYFPQIGTNGTFFEGLNNTNTAFTPSTGQITVNSTTITLVNTGDHNVNGATYVDYCFSAVAGYSAFGSYTGNGSSDGVFVYLGFRARFLMIKCSSSTGGWVMLDTARDPYNDVDNYLYANSSATDAGSSNVLDINANGFKIRNSWTDINGSGTTYVYMAFAENPFKIARGR
jgi:hypothetical protein